MKLDISRQQALIPRMDVKAVALGLRLFICFESELLKEIEKRIFWTDGQDVLF